MSKILINEERLKTLLRAEYKLGALEAGGVDNWEWYSESFQQDLEFWNEQHPEQQFDYWSDLIDWAAEEHIKDYKKGNYIYILWEDGIIQGVYSSYNKAYEAMCAAIDKVDSVKVDWANEDCGFTTVYTTFGEKVEFEISDELEVM